MTDKPTAPDYAFAPALRRDMEARLSRFTAASARTGELRLAAVAILVAPRKDSHDAGVLITLRPTRINRHSGQYALPGGRLDEGETPLQAAIRETREELGLTLTEADLIGTLDDYPTRSGFAIAAICCRRGSGTGTTPTLGSMVQNGKFSASILAPVSALYRVDLPTLERPTSTIKPVFI